MGKCEQFLFVYYSFVVIMGEAIGRWEEEKREKGRDKERSQQDGMRLETLLG